MCNVLDFCQHVCRPSRVSDYQLEYFERIRGGKQRARQSAKHCHTQSLGANFPVLKLSARRVHLRSRRSITMITKDNARWNAGLAGHGFATSWHADDMLLLGSERVARAPPTKFRTDIPSTLIYRPVDFTRRGTNSNGVSTMCLLF